MSVEKVRTEFMRKINSNNEIEVEKVERYINLLHLFYKLDEAIEEFGTMITTENGAQRFTKPNPAIAEKNKISGSLLALEKSFNFNSDDGPKTKGVDALI